uniref:Uncharacterized protein n=1 Tax=Tanacetum cinerariifolium TaxID=118510 RepID=A0A699I039_TANCI|nr:hypothetical protein [Tanacetum cinerariifolium]
MESLNPQVVTAAKLPILNPNEFDLWKMRIKQYFLMTDYSLWEVISNGDSPSPTRIVDDVIQIIAPATAEQSNLKIYEAEVKGSSTSSQNTQNITFVSSNNTYSTNKSVSVVPSVSAASSKATVSTLPNVDCLSDVVIYSFFASQSNSPHLDNEDLKQIDLDDLEEMNLKWQMDMLTMRARRFLKRTGRNLGANGTYTIGFDMSKVECYNCYKRVGGYDWSFQANEEPTNYALIAYASSGSSSSLGSDNEVAPCPTAYSIAYATLQTHYDNLTVDFRKSQFDVLSYKTESQVSDKTGLGFDSQVFDRQVFECEELHSHEYDNIMPNHPENDRYKTGEGYHAVPPPYTGTFMPPNPDLVFNDDPNASESVAYIVHVKSSINKPSKDMSKTLSPDAPIIEDWISDSEDETEHESVRKQIEPSFVLTSEHVKTHRESVKKVEHPKKDEKLRTNNQKSRGHKKNWNQKACFVCSSLNHLIKDCDYYERQMV